MSKCYYCHDARNGCAECKPKIKSAAEQALKSIEEQKVTRLEDLLEAKKAEVAEGLKGVFVDNEVSGNVEFHTHPPKFIVSYWNNVGRTHTEQALYPSIEAGCPRCDILFDWFASLCREVQALDASIKLELVALVGKPAYVYARTSFDFHPDPKQRPRVKGWAAENLSDPIYTLGQRPWRFIVDFWERRRAIAVEQLKADAGCPA